MRNLCHVRGAAGRLRLNVDILQLQELLMDIGEMSISSRRWQPAGLTPPRYQKDFMRGGAVTRRDGATTGCAFLGKQIIREILYYVLTGPCGARYWRWSVARLTSV